MPWTFAQRRSSGPHARSSRPEECPCHDLRCGRAAKRVDATDSHRIKITAESISSPLSPAQFVGTLGHPRFGGDVADHNGHAFGAKLVSAAELLAIAREQRDVRTTCGRRRASSLPTPLEPPVTTICLSANMRSLLSRAHVRFKLDSVRDGSRNIVERVASGALTGFGAAVIGCIVVGISYALVFHADGLGSGLIWMAGMSRGRWQVSCWELQRLCALCRARFDRGVTRVSCRRYSSASRPLWLMPRSSGY